MWKDILKLQIQQGGYAQLDFDNIVEGEEDNCKRKVKRISDNFKNINIKGEPYTSDNDTSSYKLGEKYHSLTLYHGFKENYPEEVYCKFLELIVDGKTTGPRIKMGDATLTMLVENERNHVSKIVLAHKTGGSIMMLGYIYHFRDGNKNEQIISKLESAFNVV